MTRSLSTLAEDLLHRAGGRNRYILAIAGPPGAGKSTFAEALLAAVEARVPGRAALVPMDGYHFDNAVLVERGLLARKGAPETFNVDGLAHDLARIRLGGREVAVPVFDRGLDLARGSARIIHPAQSLIFVEGNYLLLDAKPWSELKPLFDRSLMLRVEEEELRRRLIQRWLDYGLSAEAARQRAEANDLVNARAVIHGSRPADVTWPAGGQ